MAEDVEMPQIAPSDFITDARRGPVSSALLRTLEQFTMPQIIKLLVPYSNPSKAIKRKREALLEFAMHLPIMAQVIILASATHIAGTKRKAAQDPSEPRASKRRRRTAQPNQAAPIASAPAIQLEGATASPNGGPDNLDNAPTPVGIFQAPPHGERVHRGTIQDLISGPFLAQVPTAVIDDCISRCIDRTGNKALKKSTCVSCARQLFLPELEEILLADIPNKHLLQPTHPHPAQHLWEGLLLHEPALKRGPPHHLCSTCRGLLLIHERPPLSLANNMWVGTVPFVLSILTLPERLLVALYFPAAYVVKLFPKKAGGKKWDKGKINSGMRGNVSTYRLNTKDIADMVEGKLMPRPVGILAAIVAITFVGAKNVPLLLLPDIFDVRRQRVADALIWLKENNPLYAGVEISAERLAQLPVSGVPDELLLNVRYAPDESILQREHAGYVPVDLGDDPDVHEDPEEALDGEDLPEVADGEEREVNVDDNERHSFLQSEEDGDVVGTPEHWEPAVFPLQAHGSVDVGGEGIPEEELFANAVQKMQPSVPAAPTRKRADYGVRPGSEFVNEYAREVAGKRTNGGAEDPNHLLGAFPCLFPYGYGGLEVDRVADVPYGTHVRWCLQYDDTRFRRDLHFVFQVFGVKQKRDAAGSSCLQIRRSTYIANESAFHRLRPEDFIKASREEASRQPISNPVIRSLRKQLTAVRARVMGTDESRIAIRAQVWGMILEYNPPTLWMTVNLSDTGDPIAQVLAGQEINLDRFVATAGPDSDLRSRIIATDPYAAAEFFHLFVGVLLEELFGVVVNTRGSIDRKPGVVGLVNGYIGTVEAQARGTLHLHMLLWLHGAPVAGVMKVALATEAFRDKVKNFIRQNIRADIAGTDAVTLPALPVERNIAYSRPEDPREPDYRRRATAAESRIARAVQPHECKPFTCLKLKKGRLICKRRAPWKTAVDDWITESGDWGPRRLWGFINAWNPSLLQVTRCNQDMKLVTNGAETKDITFYITLYIAKRQIQEANASALLAKSTAFQEKYKQANTDSARRNKRLLQRCTNTLSRQHEFSAPEVISYLMGWGDRFISHTYVKVYWDQITAQLRRTFPNLIVSQSMQTLESTMTMAPPTAEEQDDSVGVLTQNENGAFVLKDQLREYQDRGDALERMNFYDYFRETYDGKMISRSNISVDPAPNTFTAGGVPRRRGGRPASQRVPYRDGRRPNRCRVIRGWKQEVNLHFIGRWFPRAEDGSREYYCAQMLLLLQPWRDLRDLPNGRHSFDAAYGDFLAEATAEQLQVIENIKYFYECSDRASQRREEDNAAVDGQAGVGEGGGQSTVQPANTVALAELREPTEADIERAREERYAARERIYGQGAIDTAMNNGIFQEEYNAVPPNAIVRQASLEDAVKYEEWGRRIASFVRVPERGDGDDPSRDDGIHSEDGEVVFGAVVGESRENDPGGVVNLGNDFPPADPTLVMDLNAEQSRAHRIVVDHLQETLAGRAPPQLLMIIRGAGGTGKTVLLNAIAQSFDALNASALLAKTATTGVAASLFGGQTLHSWAGIGIGESSTRPSQATREKRQRNMTQTRYLLIDEYSMLTKKLVEQLSNILGSVKEPLQECDASDCFGGINVILVGDLHQFPPVGSIRQALFYDGEEAEKHSPIGLDLYRRFTTVVTLTEQRRVTDPVWMEFLGRLREGECTENDMTMLESLRVGDGRAVVDWTTKPWVDAVLVTPRHTARAQWNDECLRRHAAQTGNIVYRFPAHDKISRTGAELSQWERFAVAQRKPQQTAKLSDHVLIAVGMRAMVMVNISTDAELANGTRGIVHDVVLDWREKLPLKPPEPTTGEIRLEYPPAVVLFKPDSTSCPAFEELPAGVIPIVPSQMKFSVTRADKSKFTVLRTQVAITPGYAFTDYKSQGQTLEYVVIDLAATPSGALTPFNAYVALSRSHGRENIRILRGFDPKLFTVHPSMFLRREDQRLAHYTLETTRADVGSTE